MPANLTPEYEKAELRYRQATSNDERIMALQEMLAAIPKHKGTEKMQADLKRRLSQMRHEQQTTARAKGPDPFHIPRSGAGQVVLIGLPNAGKSSLLVATTAAEVKVGAYPFTTVLPHPGMWIVNGISIELVDTPPIAPDHMPPGLMGTIRSADVICLVVEAGEQACDHIEAVLAELSAREVTLRTRPRNQLLLLDPQPRVGLIVVNKSELADPSLLTSVRELYAPQLEVIAVSAQTRQGLDVWFRRLWELLALIRVHTKQPGHPPDLQKPFTLSMGSTVADLARLIHRDLSDTMKFARIWGQGRFDGQQVHKLEVLKDGDVVEIHE